MANSIKTTGQLREFLANMLVGINNGDLDPERARTITKMAGQINESFYAEIKTAKIRSELGENIPTLGDMNISGTLKV